MSCGDQLADLNNDPNVSTSAGDGTEVFVAATGFYGGALEAYFNENDALFAQYHAGGVGVSLVQFERYFFQPGSFNTEWTLCYMQALTDFKYVIESENQARSAAADVMSVMIFQSLVDHFGDVPYTEALQGLDGNLSPAYSDDAEIYADLVVRLNQDIATLESTVDEMGAEDLIYGGDISKWIKFANSLKLRILMRQSIVNPSGVSAEVIATVNDGRFINSLDDIARIPFSGGATNNWNPEYARRESGVGQFYCLSQTFLDQLTVLNDPRLDIMYDFPVNSPGTHNGMLQGNANDVVAASADDFSYPSAFSYGESTDVVLMSPWEVMFLRAEADMRFNTADDEVTMFNNAVQSHFDYVGAGDASSYLTNSANYSASASTQAKTRLIAIQKWISLSGYQEAEGWIETRRFDSPGNKLFTDGIFRRPTRSVFGEGQFPTTYLYPQTELSFNTNNVPPRADAVSDKVFWDN